MIKLIKASIPSEEPYIFYNETDARNFLYTRVCYLCLIRIYYNVLEEEVTKEDFDTKIPCADQCTIEDLLATGCGCEWDYYPQLDED